MRTLDVGYIDVRIDDLGFKLKGQYVIGVEWNETRRDMWVEDEKTRKSMQYNTIVGALNALYTWGWEVVSYREVDVAHQGKKRKWLLRRRH